jgi:hypothetical protein
LGDRESGDLNPTFPSLKDKACSKAHPGKISCQMHAHDGRLLLVRTFQREINEAVSARDEKCWVVAVEKLELESHIDLPDISTARHRELSLRLLTEVSLPPPSQAELSGLM